MVSAAFKCVPTNQQRRPWPSRMYLSLFYACLPPTTTVPLPKLAAELKGSRYTRLVSSCSCIPLLLLLLLQLLFMLLYCCCYYTPAAFLLLQLVLLFLLLILVIMFLPLPQFLLLFFVSVAAAAKAAVSPLSDHQGVCCTVLVPKPKILPLTHSYFLLVEKS